MRGKVSEERKLKEERRGKVKGWTVGTEWGQGGEKRRETRERRVRKMEKKSVDFCKGESRGGRLQERKKIQSKQGV